MSTKNMAITKTTHDIISVKEAVHIAIETTKTIFEGQQLLDVALEEVELTEDNCYWLITIGFSIESTATASRTFVFNKSIEPDFVKKSEYIRKYKLFKIDAKTGEVQSMKIRAIA